MDTDIEIIVKRYGSHISCDFYKPIDIPMGEYDAQLGIKNFCTFNNIPNIVAGKNNTLKIIVRGGDWKLFSLPTGAYELAIIARQIVDWIEINYPNLKNVAENFKLVGKDATSKAEFIFKDDYGVRFDVDDNMYELLGFDEDDKFEGRSVGWIFFL